MPLRKMNYNHNVNPGEKVELTREVSQCMQIGNLITLNYKEVPQTQF